MRENIDILGAILMKKITTQTILTKKHVLLWCDKNEIYDEIIRRKEIDIYQKFKFLFFIFFHLAKIWYAKCKFLPSNQKTFYTDIYSIQYKTD